MHLNSIEFTLSLRYNKMNSTGKHITQNSLDQTKVMSLSSTNPPTHRTICLKRPRRKDSSNYKTMYGEKDQVVWAMAVWRPCSFRPCPSRCSLPVPHLNDEAWIDQQVAARVEDGIQGRSQLACKLGWAVFFKKFSFATRFLLSTSLKVAVPQASQGRQNR